MVMQALFAAGDVYLDDPYQDTKFRYEHKSGRVFARYYGKPEYEISRTNSFWGEAKSAGKQISREEYYRDD